MEAGAHLVSILDAGEFGGSEAIADFYAFDGVDRHHGASEIGRELAIDRCAPARGHAFGDDLDNRANGIAGLAEAIKVGFPAFRGFGVGAEEWIAIDFCPIVSIDAAKVWLGHDYDRATAIQARRFLFALWNSFQDRYGSDPYGPLNGLFQDRSKKDPELARLLGHMAPADPVWDRAFRPKALEILESLSQTRDFVAQLAEETHDK